MQTAGVASGVENPYLGVQLVSYRHALSDSDKNNPIRDFANAGTKTSLHLSANLH